MDAVSKKDDVGMCRYDAIGIDQMSSASCYCTEDALVSAVGLPDGSTTCCA